MKFVFTGIEVKEILISAVVLSVAFAISYQNGILNLNTSTFPTSVVYAFIAVGIGFLAHELIGHKIVAQHMGMHGEYRMWRLGLIIALLSSLVGFVFAAPGAVYVAPRYDIWGKPEDVSKKKMGIVSIMGPIVNLSLAFVFIALKYLYAANPIFDIAIFVNIWLGLFNMLPIPPLDGSKVLAWNKIIWAVLIVVLAILFILML